MLFYRRFYGFAGPKTGWMVHNGWFSIGFFGKKVKGRGNRDSNSQFTLTKSERTPQKRFRGPVWELSIDAIETRKGRISGGGDAFSGNSRL
jgi:hypothetical protein